MLGLLHGLAARPWIYDRIQTLAGQDRVYRHMLPQFRDLHPRTVVDVGGGTGTMRRLWPADCRYICLDLEMPKLRSFRVKTPGGLAVLADATRMSILGGVADVVIAMAFLHHLADSMVDQALEECGRILAPGGCLILLDPILAPQRRLGSLLWRLDRGAYPRTAASLRGKLESRFRITHWEIFAIYHEYVFGIAVRR